ncbi:MAG: sigma-70 family RNA polymerase sigma factor [Chitinophaga sp.]|uniref:RNA polymerase sigma factor n=1 Tax=Chitinophaga sp. TaxID=1869181 RepID=UPI0025BBE1F2|nr:sigma-70 family RNA polymerase sigma factor [Chitinophaga sp.]MBV8252253.1 sigma-70 family RNA polymerase sigma factor [Chitinophaga sp.]
MCARKILLQGILPYAICCLFFPIFLQKISAVTDLSFFFILLLVYLSPDSQDKINKENIGGVSVAYHLYQEQELLERIGEGDEQAFAVFFRELAPVVRAHIRCILQDDEEALEVLQETFIRVWLQRDKLAAIEHLVAYIKQIAARQCFSLMHRNALRRKRLEEHIPGTVVNNEGEQLLSYKEAQQVLHDAVADLPAQRKQIYLLSRSKGLSTLEIASELNLSHSYVRNTLSTAQQFIRERLRKAGKHLPILLLML